MSATRCGSRAHLGRRADVVGWAGLVVAHGTRDHWGLSGTGHAETTKSVPLASHIMI